MSSLPPPARHEATLVIQSTHAVEVSSVAWSPDGRLVATSDGHDVRLWDSSTGELRGVVTDLLSPGARLAFGPDGTTLAIAAYERIVMWDLATSSIRRALATDGHAKALAWSRTGDTLAAVTAKGSTYVWNTRDGTKRAGGTISLPAHWYTVDDALISADGSSVLIRGFGAVAKAAFPAGGDAALVYGDEARELPTEHSLIAPSGDGRTWDPDSIRLRAHTPMGAPAAFATASRDASRVLAVREDGLAVVWDAPGRQVLSTLQGTPLSRPPGIEPIEHDTFDFSDDGSRVQAISVAPGGHGWELEYTLRVWSAGTGRLESTRTVAGSGVVVRPSRDGSRRAFLSSPYYLDPGYRLFLGGVPEPLVAALAKDPRLVFDVAWSSDGSRLSITRARTRRAVRDDVVHERWDVATGRRVASADGADAEEKIESPFVVDEDPGTPPRLRVTRNADAAWLDLTPLFGPGGPELVIESSGGAIDVAPSSSALVRFRAGPDLRTSPIVGAGDPRGRALEPSLVREFLR